ncbi:MAG: SMC-Scp complex subunit ScpB [Anaerolineales bacterium]|nr:SMC-Scp complex subunit ScpB [Anaerolineales bacterium]
MTTQSQETLQPLSQTALLESLLFVADGPVTVSRLAQALSVSPEATLVLLKELEESLTGRGVRLQWSGQKTVQLTTAAAAAGVLERFLGLEETNRLSMAALEALAIIAYRQPVTRPEVDSIRGVNSDSVIRSLLSNGLIEDMGRAETPGRPILYGTTPAFLQHFGLVSIEELPDLEYNDGETGDGEDLNHSNHNNRNNHSQMVLKE